MPKMRVHELAKELNISTKELINIMAKNNIEDKKTMSSVSDDEITKVRGFFSKSQEEKPTPAPRQERPQSERPQGERPQGDRPQGERPQSDRPQRPQGDRPQGDRPQRPQGERPQGDRPQRPQGDRGPRPQGDRPQRPYGDRPQRPQGDRPPYQGNRPQGDRPPYQGNRPQGDRPPYQGNRPQGDRPPYQGNRPQGDRPPYQGNRPQGDRPPYQNNRPQGGGQSFGGPKPTGDIAPPTGDRRRSKDKPKQAGAYDSNKRPGEMNRRPGQTGDTSRRGGKQALQRGMGVDENYMTKTQKSKAKRKLQKQQAEEQRIKDQAAAEAMENDIKVIQVGKSISVSDLATKLGRPVQDIIMPLMKIGIMANVNQEIDYYTAAKIAEEYDILVEELEEIDILHEALGIEETEEQEELKEERPPVVVVMGHVDHGKTSLLDAIRSENVASGEAGGITQAIGAYQVSLQDKDITFLDTPGHEAFTAMRMRGAQVTDIAILVVAADDGVMPQTIEAINHGRAAGLEIIVAINKIDKQGANPDRVKQELSDHGLVPEDWGGSTICVPVSARQRIGIDDLLENILLVAELKELKANANKRAKGTVIEANLDRGRGSVATVLIQEGTLSIGDPVVVGSTYGKIRAMMNHHGERVKTAGPSMPVEILGLNSVPGAGDMLYVAESERQAHQVAGSMVAQGRENMIKSAAAKVSLDDLFDQIKAGNVKDLNVVIKADVQGSVEALKNSLERLSNDEVRIKTIHGGVGQVTENDIMLASASNAIIIGFNVRYENTAKQLADAENVDIRLYRVIYNAIEDIAAAMKGLLDPIFEEKVIGHAEIRQLFKASGTAIAGSYVTDGKITRNSKVRVIRDGKTLYDGELGALRRFKDDVKEVATGYECGLSFEKFNDLQEGDKVQAYIMEQVER